MKNANSLCSWTEKPVALSASGAPSCAPGNAAPGASGRVGAQHRFDFEEVTQTVLAPFAPIA
jgi:hypothetical protein